MRIDITQYESLEEIILTPRCSAVAGDPQGQDHEKTNIKTANVFESFLTKLIDALKAFFKLGKPISGVRFPTKGQEENNAEAVFRRHF